MLEQKFQRQPTYDLDAVQPMRDELVAVGFEDLSDSPGHRQSRR